MVHNLKLFAHNFKGQDKNNKTDNNSKQNETKWQKHQWSEGI